MVNVEDPRPNGPKEIPFEALETVEAVNEMIHHDQNSGKTLTLFLHFIFLCYNAPILPFINNLEPMTIIVGKMHKVMIPAADWMTIRANLIKKKCAETIPNSRKFLKHLCEDDKVFLSDEENNVFKIDEENKVSLSDRENKASKSDEEDHVSKNDDGDQVSKIVEEDAVSKSGKEANVFKSDEEDKVSKSGKEDNVFKSDEEDKISLKK